jgi:hypothetical protein
MQLYRPPPRPATTTSAPTRQTLASGRNLKRLVHGKSARERAKAAAMLVTGEFVYHSPTVAQAARLCGVAASRVHAALGHAPKPPSDAKIDRMIRKFGADAIMRGLDRYTAPRFAFAAE